MQTRHVPAIDRRYWFGIVFASIFGTNLGDFMPVKADCALVSACFRTAHGA